MALESIRREEATRGRWNPVPPSGTEVKLNSWRSGGMRGVVLNYDGGEPPHGEPPFQFTINVTDGFSRGDGTLYIVPDLRTAKKLARTFALEMGWVVVEE